MKKKYKRIAAGFIAVICIVAGLVMALKPLEVETEVAMRADMEDVFQEDGTLVPEKSTLVSSRLAGEIQDITVQPGQRVSEGEPLVELDDASAREGMEDQIESLKLQKSALYAQSKAGKSQLQVTQKQLTSQLEQARLEYNQLFGPGGDAEQLLTIAENNYATAKAAHLNALGELGKEGSTMTGAQVDALEAQRGAMKQALLDAQNRTSDSTKAYYEGLIASYESQIASLNGGSNAYDSSASSGAKQLDLTIEELKEQLAKGPATMPYEGIVWEVLAEEGSFVTENQPLIRVYQDGEMKIEAWLLAEDTLGLQEGDKVRGTLEDGTPVEAEITFISPLAQEQMSSLGISESRCQVELMPMELPSLAGAGHKITISFRTLEAENTLSVPTSALVPSEDASAVYAVRSGKAVLLPVETGVRSDGRVEILSGIEEGDEIIINPYDAGVKNHARVKGI